MQALFAMRLDLSPFWQRFAVGAGLVLTLCHFLPLAAQIEIGVSALAGIGALYAVQLYAVFSHVPPETAAHIAGRAFDRAGVYEKIDELRKQGISAYPATPPREVYRLTQGGLIVNGKEVLPLSGISNALTVFCNESGQYSLYRSDEHGFNNPAGIWARGHVDIAVIGDSFAHGSCVAPDQNMVAGLRSRYPSTLNLGMAGNGPLLELATLREYLPALRPKVVLWLFYRNDLADLKTESTIPLLMRYLEQASIQNLAAQQEAIEDRLKELVASRERTIVRWPTQLSSAGLTRQAAPSWLQDLVLGEDLTSIGRFIRLRDIYGYLDTLTNRFHSTGHSSQSLTLLLKILAKAQATAEGWGGKLYVVSVPSYVQIKYGSDAPYQDALEVAASLNLPVIDLYPAFAAQPSPLKLFWYPYSHYNEKGYRVASEAILRYLATVTQ